MLPADPMPLPLDHLVLRGADEAAALVLRDRVLTYAELREGVARLAAWLAERAAPGERIASWAAKGELTSLLPLAAARAGLIHVPINPLLKRAQAAHILADSGATLLLATSTRLSSLVPDDLPQGCATFAEDDVISQSRQLVQGLPPSHRDPESLAALLYTSGSTGKPKGVMLSHANLWLGAVSVVQYLGLREDDVILAVLPFSFDYGQNQLLSAWYAGGSVVPLDYLTPRDVSKACARHGVTTLAGVPPLWVHLLECEWSLDAVAPLRRLTNSGGALTTGLVRALRSTFPQAALYPMYGLTEAFRSTYLDPALVDRYPTAIGTAIPFAEVLVIDEDGRLSAPQVEGELVHCGPLVAKGYWRDPERTAERFRPAPDASKYGGTAVWSGDRVIRDDAGLLHFVGRRDEMIKSSGHRISPQEVEAAALATGLVLEAVALGVADERIGQTIHLVVRPPVEGAIGDTANLRKALTAELPGFMQPHAIHWRDALPRNANGKLDRAGIAADVNR